MQVALLGYGERTCSALADSAKQFSKVLVPIYTPTSVGEFLHTLTNLGIVSCLGCSGRCLAMSHCDFNVPIPGDWGWAASFYLFIGQLVGCPVYWRSCSDSLPVFHCFAFFLWEVKSITLWTRDVCGICELQMPFSHSEVHLLTLHVCLWMNRSPYSDKVQAKYRCFPLSLGLFVSWFQSRCLLTPRSWRYAHLSLSISFNVWD